MIKFTSTNYEALAEGMTKKIPTKVHNNITVSTNGIEEETNVRVKMDYEINIAKIEQADYNDLLNMFSYENDFSINDNSRNHEGTHYKITGTTFSLTEIENKNDKNFYYTGAFGIVKI